MTLAGVKPLGIFSSLLMEDDGALANLSTLYNERTKLRKDKRNKSTQIQALFDDLQARNFTHFYRCVDDGAITSLSFAHKNCIRLACRYDHIVIIDCTYKTTKYRLPLLHMVGMISFNIQFSVGFCFLKEEKQNDYMWAISTLAAILTPETRTAVIVTDRELSLMSAIDKIFPSSSHMLCTWHIKKHHVQMQMTL